MDPDLQDLGAGGGLKTCRVFGDGPVAKHGGPAVPRLGTRPRTSKTHVCPELVHERPSSTVRNSQEVDTTQWSMNQRTDKQKTHTLAHFSVTEGMEFRRTLSLNLDNIMLNEGRGSQETPWDHATCRDCPDQAQL